MFVLSFFTTSFNLAFHLFFFFFEQRFYNVFESIVSYYKDLSRYLSELDDGVFIQLSIEVCSSTFIITFLLLLICIVTIFFLSNRLCLRMKMANS